MIQLQSATLQRGQKILFDNANLSLHHGWHVGIVGKNGAGKSSLFALLRGKFSVEEGSCKLPKHWHIAHMSQELAALDQPALDFVIDGDQELRQIERKIVECEQTHDIENQAKYHLQLENIDGYRAETRAAKILHGLGFDQHQFTQAVSTFSGGWRVRLNLAQTLMCRSDLLLLDEPTNHLDLDAILWFEQWLKNYRGTLLLISHDREFLDQTVQHIIHFDNRQLNYYHGNYSTFEITRGAQLAQQQALFNKQQAEIAHIQSFINRFKAKATKAKQAQSRVKALERLERIAPAHISTPFSFKFLTPDKLSDPLLKLSDATLGYDNQTPLVEGANIQLKPGDRIGILGPNGAGKSTFIKTLAGDIPLLNGKTWLSAACRIGYFAQHQLEQLDTEATPLQIMIRLSPSTSELELRKYLGSFDFHGDEVETTVTNFSGGEKSRLGLALLIWQKPNVLLLDEPTNHLDLEMRHALTLALQDFEGAVVIISHDRHLLQCATDSLYLIAEGHMSTFEGNLEEYSDWLSSRRQINNSLEDSSSGQSVESTSNKKEERKKAAQKRQQLKPLRDKLKKTEKEMSSLQEKKAQLETQLSHSEIYEASNKQELKQLLCQQAETQLQLEQMELEWLEISEQLELAEKSPP